MYRFTRKTFIFIFLPATILFCVACSVDSSVGYRNVVSILGGIWEFEEPENYTFDETQIEVVDNKAKLKEVDQTHSGSDFERGTHVGTSFVNGTVKLNSNVATGLSLSPSWTPKYSSLVGYWNFDETLWTGALEEVLDNSSNANHGRATNGATTVTSAVATRAGSFDGISQNVRIERENQFEIGTGAFSLSMWVFKNTTGRMDFFNWKNLGINDDVSIYAHSSGYIRVYIRINGDVVCGISGVSSMPLNSWNHVLISRDPNSNLSLFVNGKLDITQSCNADLNEIDINTPIFIGSNHDTNDYNITSFPWDGKIDEVAIWKDSLSPSEVSQIYSSQLNLFSGNTELNPSWTPRYSNIAGYWKMDGSWQDSSGNGNHGVANGSTAFTASSMVGSQAGTFSASDSYVDVGTIDMSTWSTVSLSGWFKTSASALSRLISIQYVGIDDLRLTVNVDGSVTFSTDDGTPDDTTSRPDLNDGQWHHFVATFNGTTNSLYIDGVLSQAQPASFNFSGAAGNIFLARHYGGANFFNGELDDFAIWDRGLDSSEVTTIYNRQKQKYSGTYISPVIDLGNSGTWTNLNPITSLPFGKEIVAQTSESSSDYSSLSGDLSNGLVGYWPLNETTPNSVGGYDFEDKSGNSNHGSENGSLLYGVSGIVSRATDFDGGVNSIEVTDSDSLSIVGDITLSAWINVPDFTDWQPVIGKTRIAGAANPFPYDYYLVRTTGIPRVLIGDGTGGYCLVNGSIAPAVNRWNHISVTRRGNTIYHFLNGELNGTGACAVTAVDGDTNVYIGSRSFLDLNFKGKIDDTAVWNRGLSDQEIQQLYRRGANRIRYQVKSCVDSACECKSYNTAPVGSASDCDGDGIPNATDFDDIFKAEFAGPGGNGVTAFSELFNRESGDMTFTCNANTTDTDNDICVDDEITISGESKAASASFSFSDFPSSARPTDNRYFQYRVMMEAEENTACGGDPCLPELTSIEIGPTGRYFSGTPSIVNKSSHPIDKALDNLQVSASSGCDLNYQISNDGNSFYYWNGSSWVAGSNSSSQAMSLETLNSNIKSFTDHIGLGDFYFRSYLGNSNFGECEIDKVQIIKARR